MIKKDNGIRVMIEEIKTKTDMLPELTSKLDSIFEMLQDKKKEK